MHSKNSVRVISLLFVGIGLGFLSAADGATIRVPQDKPTITAGIAAAQEGDTVLVSNGTYQEHNITITNAITVTSVNGNKVTAVDGQQISGTRIFTVNSTSPNWVTISGFSIVNANQASIRQNGVAIARLAGNVQVSSCLFSNNYSNGGTVGLAGDTNTSMLVVRDCILRNNNAENFPGIAGASVVRCLLYNNTGWNSALVLKDCRSTNCTVYGNTGGRYQAGMGGGIAVNCIFWGNAGDINLDGGPYPVTYCTVQGGYSGTGNLTSDPLFVNAANGDFHLQPTSPAIHAGNPGIFNSDGTRSDMGAYGGFFTGPQVDLIRSVRPSFSYLTVTTNYQLQVSSDMSTWTNYGSPFTATNSSMVYPQSFDVPYWSQLYFRLH